MIVAGSRIIARELADGHGLDSGEWVWIDSVGRLKATKGAEIGFGRGAEGLDDIGDIVSMSIARKHTVMFGFYPGVPSVPEVFVSETPPPVLVQSALDSPPEKVDRRFKANKVPGGKSAAGTSVVVEYVEWEEGYKFKVVSDGFSGHAKDLREVSALVKMRYAPKVTLKEVDS